MSPRGPAVNHPERDYGSVGTGRRFALTIAVIIAVGAVLASGIVALVILLIASIATPTVSRIQNADADILNIDETLLIPVYEGYFCTPLKPYGLTEDLRPMVCTTTATDPHYRMRRP